MSKNLCPQCGAPISIDRSECMYCGGKTARQPQEPQPQFQQPYIQQPHINGNGINYAWPIRSKVVAGLLGIFLGGLGIHKFYLGKVALGILYIFASWTFIPILVGFIEGTIYLATDDYNFQVKNHVRIQ